MANTSCSTLRPYLYKDIRPTCPAAYLRFYYAVRQRHSRSVGDGLWTSVTYGARVQALKDGRPKSEPKSAFPSSLYPRMGITRLHGKDDLGGACEIMPPSKFHEKYHSMPLAGKVHPRPDSNTVILHGKVKGVRIAGSKLIFVDVVHADVKVQVMCDLGWIHRRGLASSDELQRFRGMIKEGDYYSFAGGPIRSSTGELTLYCTSVPEALSPSLHDLPQTVINPDTLARFPQLDLAMNKQKRDLLRLRHHIERTMQEFLNTRTFIKVTTPILASDTGGAVARPFETRANEFSGSPLRLRIAQELALKKLIAADMGAVYEIGPVFRNEGIDATHNPEFTTCEFYQPYKTLDDLMSTTEELYSTLIDGASTLIASSLTSLTAPQRTFAASFPRLPFLPTLMSQLRTVAPGWKLPRDITSKSATEDLVALFTKLDMPLPPQPTAARLLDTLGARFIEPLCIGPTFVTHHPAVMSPLAKTFRDSETDHEVSARAEFFVAGTEVANMYEEENDPFTQARKFAVQRWGSDVVSGDADFEKCLEMLTPGQRYFVRVLEMGLPPTAGWGCGIDRLVMLLGGAKRIADVLPFGTLRSVVAMGAGGATDD